MIIAKDDMHLLMNTVKICEQQISFNQSLPLPVLFSQESSGYDL